MTGCGNRGASSSRSSRCSWWGSSSSECFASSSARSGSNLWPDENSLLGNLAGVAFGVFMYFPTLVEVPIAKMFLSLGMHRGPLLAYLMADPELSLQSILLVGAIIGRAKAWTYVAFVALFSTAAGLIYGAWVDKVSLGLIVIYLGGFLALLATALYLVGGRGRRQALASALSEGRMPGRLP